MCQSGLLLDVLKTWKNGPDSVRGKFGRLKNWMKVDQDQVDLWFLLVDSVRRGPSRLNPDQDQDAPNSDRPLKLKNLYVKTKHLNNFNFMNTNLCNTRKSWSECFFSLKYMSQIIMIPRMIFAQFTNQVINCYFFFGAANYVSFACT